MSFKAKREEDSNSNKRIYNYGANYDEISR